MRLFKQYIYLALIFVLNIGIAHRVVAQRSYTTMPTKMIVGHMKGMTGTYKSYELLINQISPEFPYTIVLERGASFCYFINKYINDK